MYNVKYSDNFVYFDCCRCAINGKIVNGFSFKLDEENLKVIYSKECDNFLRSIRDYLVGKRKSNSVTLNTLKDKSNFENIICQKLLKLKFNGVVGGYTCYAIPNTLRLQDFTKVLDYTVIHHMVNSDI